MGRDSTMEGGSGVKRSREGRSWIALGISAVLLLIALTPTLSHILVNLSNSREGHPVLPSTLPPGGFVSGEVVLHNQGILPISVTLQPRATAGELPAPLSIKIQNLSDHSYLYAGPLRPSVGPLVVLQPGGRARLLITLLSDDPRGTSAIALPLTYYWEARPALPWWWWIPVLLIFGGTVYVGFHRSRARRL